MRYVVTWHPEAETQLASAYLQARKDGLANEFTEASAKIEKLLETEPFECSESRQGDLRILIEMPIGVYFFLLELEREVSVSEVHYVALTHR